MGALLCFARSVALSYILKMHIPWTITSDDQHKLWLLYTAQRMRRQQRRRVSTFVRTNVRTHKQPPAACGLPPGSKWIHPFNTCFHPAACYHIPVIGSHLKARICGAGCQVRLLALLDWRALAAGCHTSLPVACCPFASVRLASGPPEPAPCCSLLDSVRYLFFCRL
jgi:hypothetical protein